MAKVAFLVGVEHYRDGGISSVAFAEEDVLEVADVLKVHNVEIHANALLLDSDATKTTIESRLRQIIRMLAHDDTFYFYYAGHGFSRNDTNYITCFDTERGDLTNTSLALQSIFDLF